MALGATIYVFKIDLADSDRGVYQPLELRVARHPSETEEHLLARVLAYCLEYTAGIGFTNGLFDSDQPTIAVRDLTGAMLAWIDVGSPEAARLHRAGKLANRVAVYTDKDAHQLAARLAGEHIHRIEALELYAVNRTWLTQFAAHLTRRMQFTLTVVERNVYVSLGDATLASVIERVEIGHLAGS